MTAEAEAPELLGRLLLPDVKLQAAANAKQLEKRFNYLWQSAHATLASAAPVAHHMIASMVQAARANRVVLPDEVLDFICERCAGLLVPTVSADVRVVKLSSRSAVNRKLARQRRAGKTSHRNDKAHAVVGQRTAAESLTNALRVVCRQCQHGNIRPGASIVNKPKTKKVKRVQDEQAQVHDREANEPAAKRTRVNPLDEHSKQNTQQQPILPVELPATAAAPQPKAQTEAPSMARSMFASPPSPPRKLLDGPKRRKKKKKTAAEDPASAAAKSSLSSFLQNLRPSSSK